MTTKTKIFSEIIETFSRYFDENSNLCSYKESKIPKINPLNGLKSVDDFSPTEKPTIQWINVDARDSVAHENTKQNNTVDHIPIVEELLYFEDYPSDDVAEISVNDFAPSNTVADKESIVADKYESNERQTSNVDGDEADTLSLFDCIENYQDCVASVIREITGDDTKDIACNEFNQFLNSYDQQISEYTEVDVNSGNDSVHIPFTENNFQEVTITPCQTAAAVENVNTSLEENSKEDDGSTGALEGQQLMEPSVNKFGSDIQYVVVQDPKNPMIFTISEKSATNQSNTQSAILMAGRLHTVKLCSVRVTDCINIPRHPNQLDHIEFFAHKHDTRKPKACKNTNKKILKAKEKRQVKKPTQQKNPPKSVSTSHNLNELKIASIDAWLQQSSQIQQVDNVDLNQILQNTNLATFADIENEAFQLAKYMESIEQANDESQNINPSNPLNVPITPCNDVLPSLPIQDLTEPLILTKTQTTSTLTDKRFDKEYSSPGMISTSPQEGTPASQSYVPLHDCDVSTQTCKRKKKKSPGSQFHAIRNDCDVSTQTLKRKKNKSTKTTVRNIDTNQNYADRFKGAGNVLDHCALQNLERMKETENRKDSFTTATSQQGLTIVPTTNRIFGTSTMQSHSRSMDWTNCDNYSTDLDYEASEEYEHEDEEVRIPDNAEQQNIISKSGPKPTCTERLVIKIPNNTCQSRVVTTVSTLNKSDSTSHKPTLETMIEPLPQQNTMLENECDPATTVTIRTIPLPLMRPASGNSVLLQNQISYLFSRVCFGYLNKADCRIGCPFVHHLPPEDLVFEKLMLFPSETIKSIFDNFIVKNEMSFAKYFPTITEVLSKKKMESSLSAAIKHCENHNKIQYFIYIYRGLIHVGLPKRRALQVIAGYCCKSKATCTAILGIIIDTDPMYFIKMLKKYYKYANVWDHHMIRLLHQVRMNPNPLLLPVCVDMFEKYSQSQNQDAGISKRLLYEVKRLVAGDNNLIRRLNQIAIRID